MTDDQIVGWVCLIGGGLILTGWASTFAVALIRLFRPRRRPRYLPHLPRSYSAVTLQREKGKAPA